MLLFQSFTRISTVGSTKCQLCNDVDVTQLAQRVISNSDFPELETDASYYIWLCESCGYIFQTTNLTSRDLECYYQKYAFNFSINDTSSVSSLVQTERSEKAQKRFEFIKPYLDDAKHHSILEIGCGDGALLSLFKRDGVHLLGSELNRSHHDVCKNNGIEIVDFGLEKVDEKIKSGVDVIIMSHVLEHIPNPKKFLMKLKEYTSGIDSLLFIEVPNEMEVASPNNFSLEHVSYFFSPVLSKLLDDCGFDVLVQEKVCYETTPPSLRFLCVPKRDKSLAILLETYKEDLRQKMRQFEATFQSNKVEKLRERKVALFGGGSYAIDFIQFSGISPSVIFDNNPSKSGSYLADIIVQPISKADEYNFDVLIVTSWGSANEIVRQLNGISALKDIEIIKIRDLILDSDIPSC